MQELFFHILNRSISAGWLILAVLVLRIVLKCAPKRILVWLWGAAAVRLTVPFSIRSVLSLIPDKETIAHMTELVQSVQQSISVSTQRQDWFMF